MRQRTVGMIDNTVVLRVLEHSTNACLGVDLALRGLSVDSFKQWLAEAGFIGVLPAATPTSSGRLWFRRSTIRPGS